MYPGYGYLTALRLTKLMQAIQDVRALPQELIFVNATEFVPAMEGEIIGRWINRVQIADLVSDDAKAVAYSAGKMQVENTIVPNIKHGRKLTQENLNQLAMIGANPGLAGAAGSIGTNEIVGNVLGSIVDDLYLGLSQRCEALIVAMHLDSYTYNRFGMQITGSWGIPADLKVNLSVPWTDAANGTPVNDIWNLKRLASVRYGATFDRITMSTSAFIYMISTTEFQNKARTTIPLTINYTNFPIANTTLQSDVARSVLGVKEIRIYDSRYWSQDASGQMTSAPYLPVNKVILDSASNDNNAAVQDFANGVTTESTLGPLMAETGSGMIGSLNEGTRGPICYTTVPHDMNPPNLTVWGVQRGFPRRYRISASAVLTVGTFTDTIPTTDPFQTTF